MELCTEPHRLFRETNSLQPRSHQPDFARTHSYASLVSHERAALADVLSTVFTFRAHVRLLL